MKILEIFDSNQIKMLSSSEPEDIVLKAGSSFCKVTPVDEKDSLTNTLALFKLLELSEKDLSDGRIYNREELLSKL